MVMQSGRIAEITAKRFLSMSEPESAAICYSVRVTGGGGTVEIVPWLDADVYNEDANYDEKFWENESADHDGTRAVVVAQTRKTAFVVATAMENTFDLNGKPANGKTTISKTDRSAGTVFSADYSRITSYNVCYTKLLRIRNDPA